MRTTVPLLSIVAVALFVSRGAQGDNPSGGLFSIEGGALIYDNSQHVSPTVAAELGGWIDSNRYIVLVGGIELLPAPTLFHLGINGRIELKLFEGFLRPFVGTHVLVLQPIEESVPSSSTSNNSIFSETFGILGQAGLELWFPRTDGYRVTLSLAALTGALAPYSGTGDLRSFYYGAVANVGAAF